MLEFTTCGIFGSPALFLQTSFRFYALPAKFWPATCTAGPVRHGQQIWAFGGLARALAWKQAMPNALHIQMPPALPPHPPIWPAVLSRAALTLRPRGAHSEDELSELWRPFLAATTVLPTLSAF